MGVRRYALLCGLYQRFSPVAGEVFEKLLASNLASLAYWRRAVDPSAPFVRWLPPPVLLFAFCRWVGHLLPTGFPVKDPLFVSDKGPTVLLLAWTGARSKHCLSADGSSEGFCQSSLENVACSCRLGLTDSVCTVTYVKRLQRRRTWTDVTERLVANGSLK